MGNWTTLEITSKETGESLFYCEGGKRINFTMSDYTDFAIGVVVGKGITEDVIVSFKNDYSNDECDLNPNEFSLNVINILCKEETFMLPKSSWLEDARFWEGIEEAEEKFLNGIFFFEGSEDYRYFISEGELSDESKAGEIFAKFTDNENIIQLAESGIEANILLAIELLKSQCTTH